MKITIIEANMTGLQHVPINSHFINMLGKIFSNETLELYCSKEHFDYLNIENENKILFHSIKVISSKKQRIQKFFYELENSKRVINSDTDFIIFLSCFPNVQYFITRYLRKKKYQNKKVLLITHGEMEGLRLRGKWKIWSYPFWVTLCSKVTPPKNLRRLVLGESIYRNMLQYKNFQNVDYINHPLEDIETKLVLPKNNNIVFGYIGTFLMAKGGDVLMKVSSHLNQQSTSYFEIIGSSNLKENEQNSRIKQNSKLGQFISKEDYSELIRNISYACFPFPVDSYKYTASGAVLDAIAYLKPVIYISNDYFDYLFDNCGDIGYRCLNEDEFIKCILELDSNPEQNRYLQQIENMKKLKQKLLKENIICEFEKILNSFFSF